MRLLKLLPIAALGCALAAAAPALAGNCLESNAVCQSGEVITGETSSTTTSPTFQMHCSGVVMNVEDASFDIPGGKFSVGVGEGGEMRLWLRDAFTVTGPATGTPIALHMRVRVQGYKNWTGTCCPDSQVHVGILPVEPQPGDPVANWSFGISSGPFNAFLFSDSLDITLQRTAGAPIGIAIYALATDHSSGSARLDGTFTFVDLPPGWTVSSCNGYRKDQPTPAAVASWGRVKAAYR